MFYSYVSCILLDLQISLLLQYNEPGTKNPPFNVLCGNLFIVNSYFNIFKYIHSVDFLFWART